MASSTDFRNSLDYWIPLFIIVTGFVHGATNAVWLKLAFNNELSWYGILNELVSKPNDFFWLIMILYIFDILSVIFGFVMLYGRSVSNKKKNND